MSNWIAGLHELTWQLTAFSITAFIFSLLLVPIIVIHLPSDYFSRNRRSPRKSLRHPATALLLTIAKNALGILFILAGIAMLILPGQGLLTITVGLMMMNFPGKYRLEQWLISRPSVLKAFNWIRSKAHKAPLITN